MSATTGRSSNSCNVHVERPARPSGRRAEGGRFLVVGIANTLLTYAIYCGLVGLVPAQIAYAIVYALGIALAYAGNVWWVFRARPRVATATVYPFVYLGQYALTAGLLEALTRYCALGERLALAIAIAIVTPFSFLLNRRVLRGEGRGNDPMPPSAPR